MEKYLKLLIIVLNAILFIFTLWVTRDFLSLSYINVCTSEVMHTLVVLHMALGRTSQSSRQSCILKGPLAFEAGILQLYLLH